jgi:hypothetical protein
MTSRNRSRQVLAPKRVLPEGLPIRAITSLSTLEKEKVKIGPDEKFPIVERGGMVTVGGFWKLAETSQS